jgi:DNA helicase-2/ATP-dependent DNA helicase PcrA
MASLEQRFSADDLPDARSHLQELMVAAEEHTGLSDFLQEVALITSADKKEDERDQVQLLTIHAAKGLEWAFVFVGGLEEGTLPHERSIGMPEGVEEERRLCYVALTRAAERLYLSWSPGRSRGHILKPSRFLDEILAYGKERAGSK